MQGSFSSRNRREPLRLHSTGAVTPKRLRTAAYPGALVGLALFTALIAYYGAGDIGAALAAAGWGLLAVTLFHAAPLLANAVGWRCLLPGTARPPIRTMVLARWLSESVNGLLPVLQVGGNVVRARLIARRGVPAAHAGASVVVDVTLNVLTQVVFTLLGLCLLVVHVAGRHMVEPVLIGMAAMGTLLAGFYLTQRRGLFSGAAWLLARLTSRFDHTTLVAEAAILDESVVRLYGKRRALVFGSAWHLLSWTLGAGEIWLGLYFLGHPVPLVGAFLMESMGQAIRTAAFAVPGALGVQEGGYLLLGTLFGIGPDMALALSLVKRVRELLLGVPGLLAWQFGAATRALGQRNASKDGGVS